MKRISTILVSCLALGRLALGQGSASGDVPNPTPTTEFRVTPAGEPEPALRWRLLPEIRELLPGDAATFYLRAMSPELFTPFQQPKAFEQVVAALEAPIADLRTDRGKEVQWVRTARALKEADRAARSEVCDWHLRTRIREEGFFAQLPEMNGMRTLVRHLSLRTRLALADADFPAAIHSLQTEFAACRHLGAESCTIIQSLVAVSGGLTSVNDAAEFVKVRGSPNLYWALSSLPQPLVPMRRGVESERMILDTIFPGYREALESKTPPPPLDLIKLRKTMKDLGLSADPFTEGLVIGGLAGRARDYLLAHGWTKEGLAPLPVTTIVFLHEVADYDRYFDEGLKWVGVSPIGGLPQVERLFHKDAASGKTGFLTRLLLPSLRQVCIAQLRLDRRLAGLRCVEATRLHAAATGRLPSKATDVVVVPVPTDPLTNKSFEFSSTGDSVTIVAPAEGFLGQQQIGFRYVVRLADAK